MNVFAVSTGERTQKYKELQKKEEEIDGQCDLLAPAYNMTY